MVRFNLFQGLVLTAALICAGCADETGNAQKEIGEVKKTLTSQVVFDALDGATNVAQLTIESSLQSQVTSILNRWADTNHTGIGWAVVMSVSDGAVLAMADCGVKDTASRPLAVKKTFEPGHTVSPFAVAVAFNEGIATPNTMISTEEEGEKYVGIRSDKELFKVSQMSVKEALPRSVNSVIGKIGQDLGDKVYGGLASFGLSKETLVDFGLFDVEGVGGLNLSKMKGDKEFQSRVSMGQGFHVSAMQLARAYLILANQGRWAEPCLERIGERRLLDKSLIHEQQRWFAASLK